MHTIKITPNILFEYQCTSGKFIKLPNRIDKIDSLVKIESKLFCPNWNALIDTSRRRRYLLTYFIIDDLSNNTLRDMRIL